MVGFELPTAIDVSSVVGLIAVGIFTAQILLVSSTAGFRLFDVFVPIWSPTQPIPNTLGAVGLYLIAGATAWRVHYARARS